MLTKYTDAGGRIKVSVTNDNGVAVVQVKDNGIGLQPENFASIFEMFSQVDRTTTRSYSGLGIGLALVKKLVESHGGTVAASSEGIGKGTTITVSLPMVGVGSMVDA